jgi:hypothetical protein
MELKRSGMRSLLRPLVGVSRACEMGNKSQLGGGESIAMGEGVVITSTPLGFPSFPGHAGKSMEVMGLWEWRQRDGAGKSGRRHWWKCREGACEG